MLNKKNDYYLKYLKYKNKYLKEKSSQIGGETINLILLAKNGRDKIVIEDVDKTNTIRELKQLILDRISDLPADYQDKTIDNLILFYKGKKLSDDNTVALLENTQMYSIDIRYTGQNFAIVVDNNPPDKFIKTRGRLVPFLLDDPQKIRLGSIINFFNQYNLNEFIDGYLHGSKSREIYGNKMLTKLRNEDGIDILGLTYEIPDSEPHTMSHIAL